MAGREVAVSNPDKIFFPELGLTKIDLVRYYLAVADGALRGIDGRPMALKRFVNGAGGEFFFQKRAPSARPDWIETVELKFPSGRTAHEIVVRDAAQLAWIVNASGRQPGTSSQVSGVDTRPSGFGRTEYADATVRSFAFWL